MTRQSAAVQSKSGVGQRYMQPVPDQVIDQDGMPRHAQGFIHKANNIRRLKMMNKETGTYNIKTVFLERKCQRITGNRGIAAVEVTRHTIQQDRLNLNTLASQRFAGQVRQLAVPAGHVQPGQFSELSLAR